MKILKWLLYIVIALVLLVVVLGLFGPKSFDVSRSVIINAPKATVYSNANSFADMAKWGPWAEEDPNMKTEITGEDGTVGATNKWDGPKTGKGEQTFTELKENEAVLVRLKFYQPWGDSESDGYLHFEDAPEGGTKATWGIKGENSFIERAMGALGSMDAMIGPMFEKGLNNLKAIAEAEAANKTYRGYKIEESDSPARMYAGVRKKLKFADVPKFFGDNLGKVFGAAADKVAGSPSGLFFEWDEKNGTTDMAAAAPVTQAIPGFEKFEISAGKCLTINYYGAYDKSGEAHYAMDDYIKEKAYKSKTPVIEEYVTDPGKEPDTAKWLTKIIYFIEQ